MGKLYLDDVRTPHESYGFTVVRNFAEFVEYIVTKGIPDVMSLDHDLNENHYMLQGNQWSIYPELVDQQEVDVNVFGETGYDICRWLINYCEENKLILNEVYVHTMNPVGAQNMIAVLNPFMQKSGSKYRVKRGSLCLEPLNEKK